MVHRFPHAPFLMEKVGCTRQSESELSLRSFAQPFPSGYRGCTNRPTRCSNRFAIRLADHQRSTPEGVYGMGPHDYRLIPLLNSVLLYHYSDIRDFIEYGITNLIIWKFTTFTQISYKISAYTTKIRQDDFIRQELLILFFQRNHFLYHVMPTRGLYFSFAIIV